MKKKKKKKHAEKFCSNKCSLDKPTMGKVERKCLFLFSNQEKEAFSGTSWTLSPLEDKMSLN